MKRVLGLGYSFAVLASFAACKSSSDGGSSTAPPQSAGLPGTYDIAEGTNPSRGRGYEGTVTIAKTGDVLHMTWTTGASGTKREGAALQIGSNVYAGWGIGDGYGVAVYTVNGGAITGTVAAANATSVGTETLTGPPNLDGDYQIAGTRGADGGTYSGIVKIAAGKGGLYQLSYKLAGGEWLRGVGIKAGDKLVVGTGPDPSDVGVSAYDVSGATLRGTWAQSDGIAIGRETLKKK
jgi:hypothetical protein